MGTLLFLLSLLRRQHQLPSLACLTLSSLALLGVLMFVPTCLRCRPQGQFTACKSNLKNVATSLEMYASDHQGRYPERLSILTQGNYLKVIPTCPGARRDTYQANYEVTHNPDNFSLMCGGCHHHGAGLHTPNYPRYTTEQGLISRPEYE